MQLAKVIGTVVATRKEETLVGFKLLVLRLEDNSEAVAIDSLGAGVGDTVLATFGGAARMGLSTSAPVDAAIVGIVDTVDKEL